MNQKIAIDSENTLIIEAWPVDPVATDFLGVDIFVATGTDRRANHKRQRQPRRPSRHPQLASSASSLWVMTKP